MLTLVSLGVLSWLVYSIYFSKSEADKIHEDVVWDNNLREGANPAPMWWFWLILLSLVCSLIYLMLFPGLGSYKGILNWTSGRQVVRDEQVYSAEFGGSRNAIAEMKVEEIHDYPKAMVSAQRVFDRNCAVCHGYEAQGQAALFPDLTDKDWQWGGSVEQIEQSIRDGRTGNMAPWGDILGAQGVDDVTAYVMSLSGNADTGHPGKLQYDQLCVACHGTTGEGNPILGAPDLTDNTWLYGGSLKAVKTTIADGRNGVMPAFGERLDATQLKLLVALLTVENPG